MWPRMAAADAALLEGIIRRSSTCADGWISVSRHVQDHVLIPGGDGRSGTSGMCAERRPALNRINWFVTGSTTSPRRARRPRYPDMY